VKDILDFSQLPSEKRERVKKSYPNNAHVKRKHDMPVIIIGYETKSRRLNKVVLMSEKKPNLIGRPTQPVSERRKMSLGFQDLY